MSLATQISTVVTRIGTEVKAIYTKMGTLTSLTTTDKTSLVNAINEVKSSVSGAAGINDTTTTTSSTWSSSKVNTAISAAVTSLVNAAPTTLDTLKELSDALGADANFASTMTTALGLRVRVDTAAQGLTSTQKTNALTNIGAADAALVGDTTTDFVTVFNTAIA